MREEVELGPRQRLYIRAIGSIYGDGVLAVAFGEHPLPESYVLDGSAWRLVSFDLGQYSGDRGRFRLIAAAGGTMPWVYETLYLDEVCVE